MSLGLPGLAVFHKKEPFPTPGPPGPPFQPTSAANGLSVDPGTGQIVLGVSDGSGLPDANLLDSRLIPMIDNLLTFEMTNGGTAECLFIINAVAGQIDMTNDLTAAFPPLQVQWVFSNVGGPNEAGIVGLDNNGTMFFRSIDDNAVPTGFGFFKWILNTIGGGDVEGMRLTAAGTLLIGDPIGADNGRTLQVNGQVSIATDFTEALDFPNTLAFTSSDISTALAIGALPGDAVFLGVGPASVLPNSCFTAWVSAADTVTIRFNNYSAAPQDPPPGNFKISVVKLT